MVQYGYTLSSEEHGPADLVALAARAEEHGFDFVSISDHFHPWVGEQGHSPFVWSTLGAIAATTETLPVGVGVTAPIVRLHPAIVAHAAATTSLLFEGRFFLGVGTGEALNEHVLGHRWPPADTRLLMLEEAVAVMRALWRGDTVDHHGQFFDVENARLFDPPAGPLPVVVSGFGTQAAQLAGRIGDGYWGHAPDADVLDAYSAAGGRGPRYAQLHVCAADDAEKARATVRSQWPNAGLAGQLAQDLPTWTHFEDATRVLTEDQVTESVPCGPDPEDLLRSVHTFVDAGYDHLYFHQIGPDQDRFFRLWHEELAPELRRG
jgi:G6PDH family F420-dependent oxidoreductase